MVFTRREGFGDEANGDASDRIQESEVCDDSMEIDGLEASEDSIDVGSRGGLSDALPGRIGDVVRDGADANLPLGREQVENEILQWFRAFDFQVIGGCRADERLKPMLKLNASSGAAEDQFMAQLLQHFEASEVAVLARCLCLPLVSIRVGKIIKRGNMLCPTASRGFLSLTLLPLSHMRISFTGDDGCIEKLALVSNDLESSSVIIENISSDTSGRSFLLKFSGFRILYFWCSEKSKADGMELVVKMKDLLSRKPSLAYLTGISKSRLDSFATHLRAYILASAGTSTAASSSSSGVLVVATSDFHSSSEVDLCCQSRFSHVQSPATHVAKVHPACQSSLSTRPNACKDGILRRRFGDSSIHIQPSTTFGSLPDQSTSQTPGSSTLSSPLDPLTSTIVATPSQISNQSSFFSPYYCWCPPFPASLQYNTTHQLPTAAELIPLPPLSTFLSPAAPPESLITSKYPLNVTEFPPLILPSRLPDPLLHLSMPIPSLCPLPSSQQIATFTPFMSDPIVHIPIIDFCSSGQGYLVSVGPSISAAMPTLPISHASCQLHPLSESPVEKNARETLRLLMASAPTLTPPKLFNVLPEVLSSMDLCRNGISVPGKGLLDEAVESTSSAGDTSDEVFSEEIEECNCSKSNNCRMLNHEPDDDI